MRVLVRRRRLDYIGSYRDITADLFRDVYIGCATKYRDPVERSNCQGQVRMMFRSLESGRYAEMLEAISKFMGHLDADEIELFKERNPEIIQRVNEYNLIEDLRQF